MSDLNGKIAWVTGAGSGIGLAGAKALADGGATVVMSGRRKEVLEPEAEKLRIRGLDVDIEPFDVSDQAAVEAAAKRIVRRYGKIDILVNSAGMNVPHRYWKNQTPQGWNDVIRTNLDGSFYTIYAVLPGMRKRKDGVIINISSWAGAYHTKLTGAAYNASKHAVVAMTETVNMEEATNGIRACAICPAEVATPIMAPGAAKRGGSRQNAAAGRPGCDHPLRRRVAGPRMYQPVDYQPDVESHVCWRAGESQALTKWLPPLITLKQV